jgi:hypothetical protein
MDNGKKLSDSLRGAWGAAQDLAAAWDATAPAADLEPLPAGEYVCAATGGELTRARTGTPAYAVDFRVLDGEHAGRVLRHQLWLTAKALPLSKRDLAKLSIASVDGLQHPLPRPVRCRVRVALRQDDDGTRYNRVRSFEVLPGPAPEVAPAHPAPTAPEQHEAERPATGGDGVPGGLFDDAFAPEGGTGYEW